jgi:hypothetical protein
MDLDLNGGDGISWNENMNMEAETQDAQGDLLKLEQEMLEYGQALGAEYADDDRKEIKKSLGEIWALVAYANPLKEPKVSHLLDTSGRGAVAEELNSAILGKCCGRSSFQSRLII